MTSNFSLATLLWKYLHVYGLRKILWENYFQPRIPYSANLSVKCENKVKIFSDIEHLPPKKLLPIYLLSKQLEGMDSTKIKE